MSALGVDGFTLPAGVQEVLRVFCCRHTCFLDLALLCTDRQRPPVHQMAMLGQAWALLCLTPCSLDRLSSATQHTGSTPAPWAWDPGLCTVLHVLPQTPRSPLSYLQHHQDILCCVLWRKFEPLRQKGDDRLFDLWKTAWNIKHFCTLLRVLKRTSRQLFVDVVTRWWDAIFVLRFWFCFSISNQGYLSLYQGKSSLCFSNPWWIYLFALSHLVK